MANDPTPRDLAGYEGKVHGCGLYVLSTGSKAEGNCPACGKPLGAKPKAKAKAK